MTKTLVVKLPLEPPSMTYRQKCKMLVRVQKCTGITRVSN